MTFTQRAVVALLVLVLAVAGVWAVVSLVGRPASGPATTTATAVAEATQPIAPTAAPAPPMAQRTAVRTPATGPGVVGVFVEPDDGRAPILNELADARHSIDLEVYLLSDSQIIAALEQAQARGVRVRVILEQHPYGGAGNQPQIFQQLQQAGVAVRWSNPTFKLTHIKTFVIDNRTAIIMTLNLTKTSFKGDREFGAITTRPADVAQAAAIFEADWNRTAEPPPGPLVVSPTNSREVLLGLVRGAKTSIDVYAEVMQDNQIVGALSEAARRGVHVRLIMTKDASDTVGIQKRAQLAKAGVDVRLSRGVYIHAKMLLVDGQRAYIGSENFSAASLDFNRELGIILTQPANLARLSRTFDGDFAKGTKEAAS